MRQLITFSEFSRLCRWLSILLCACCGTAIAQPPEASPLTDRQQNQLDLLSSEIEPGDIKWLQDDNGQFLTLWKADQTGNPFGALLIIHGEGQSIDDPYEISAIRNNLSHHGWATLAVHLPATEKKAIPPRPTVTPRPDKKPAEAPESNSDNPRETPNKNSSASSAPTNNNQDPEKIVKARMDAAVTFLKEQGQYNIVVIGHGISANRAMRYIDILSGGRKLRTTRKRKIQRPIRAVVLVAARNQTAISDKRIDDYFNDPGLPVLDITYGEHYLDKSEIRQRAKTARAAGIRDYFQIKMLRPTGVDEDYENRLTRRIRGFLNSHAKGVEIEKKRTR